MEVITDANCVHTKKVPKDFKIKNLGEYYHLYFQSDTILFSDVFENFRNMFLKIHELDPGKFLSAPRLAWQAALKKTKVNLDLSIDIDMLLMVEKGIRRGVCHSIIDMRKLITNTWKIMIKIKNGHIFSLGCKWFMWLGNVAKASGK